MTPLLSITLLKICCVYCSLVCLGILQIFTNAFPVHYSPPTGFHFEVFDDFVPVQVLMFNKYYFSQILCDSLVKLLPHLLNFVLQDNPLLFDYNVEQRVNDFINAAMTQVKSKLHSLSLLYLCFNVILMVAKMRIVLQFTFTKGGRHMHEYHAIFLCRQM